MDVVVSSKQGRLVKSTGDGVMATFESAADAVEAGVDAQQAIVALGRELDLEELAIRIGVSAGDVSWSEHDCSGLPVVEAARLEQAAEPRQVLCSEIVRMMARGRAQVGFERVGELTLKGLEYPLMAFEVPWSIVDIDGVDDEFGAHVIGIDPTNDPSREHVEHGGEATEPGPGQHVGDVSHPQLVWSLRGEVSLDEIWSRSG